MANSAHGGFDGGAVAADGTVEKDINLIISEKIRDLLVMDGYNVIMTRNSDTGTENDSSISIAKRKKSDLENRLALMSENPDSIYVSIHLNKYTTSSAFGTQVFYSKNVDASKELGQYIQGAVVSMIQPENKRVVKKGSDSTYLLKNAKVPTVIVECGFLSNVKELELLKSDDYQSKMAFAVFSGITNFYEGK